MILFLSIAWIILCVAAMITSERDFNWVNLLYLALGLFYFIQYFYQLKKPLVNITDDSISTFSVFKTKTIYIREATEITFPFKDIEIKSKDKKISIAKDFIDEASYTKLEEQLNKIKTERKI